MAAPEHIAKACRGAADIGVRVVAIYAPGLQHSLDVAIVAGAADVIHDLG